MQRGSLVVWYRPDLKQLTFTLRESLDSPHVSVHEQPAPPQTVIDVERCILELGTSLSPVWTGPDRKASSAALEKLREALRRLLPGPLLSQLESTGTELQLRTDGPYLPWELALSPQHRGLTRELGATGTSDASSLARTGMRALLLVDPDGAQPWARAAADDLEALLSGRLKVVRLQGEQASSKALKAALEEGGFTLLHLVTSLDAGRLWLSDGYLRLEKLKELLPLRLPPLVFLGAISAGPPRPGLALAEPILAWSQALHGLGARTLIAPQWDTPSAGALAYGLYTRLLRGVDAGEALRRAREELTEDAYLSAQAWIALGNPAAALPAPMGDQPPPTLRTLSRPKYILTVEGRDLPLYPQAARHKPIHLGGPGVKPNEIELVDPALANRAACLHFVEGGLKLENLSGDSAIVKVNGLPVPDSLVLSGGELIELGHNQLRLRKAGRPEKSEPPVPSVAADRFRLVVERGLADDCGRTFELAGGVLLVGRLPECRILLRDPGVSRQHLSITYRDSTYFAAHIGASTTILNGVLLQGEQELCHGDLLQLSESTVLRFVDRSRE